jgi:hypothetical protein
MTVNGLPYRGNDGIFETRTPEQGTLALCYCNDMLYVNCA